VYGLSFFLTTLLLYIQFMAVFKKVDFPINNEKNQKIKKSKMSQSFT